MKNYSIIPEFTDDIFSERFNQIDDFFSKLTGKIPVVNYPNYDIRKIDNEKYEINISVPGFSKENIEVLLKSNLLYIKGKKNIDSNKESNYIYKGIISKNFSLNFNIGNNFKIKEVFLKNGILTINLYQEISDSEKFQKILINE
ncbi:heat shock protein Hsp20 [endosymbiont of Euscepes postfasciatus]|uniref:Hsp20 family protein n=1 Tax=endosymbiont of Euscepes postfasciatus TaxID=650377 RepID=UPI000DC6F2C2|nr:Hsp20 family protein [endosymbiont of Euscepes postfasciatus]BBA84560.1 heat shock protein Hsp20 [endosymbiont of Euscepes postfasciatus]